ncbi:6002_t:CDS:2, partial [Gigaspora margarita]
EIPADLSQLSQIAKLHNQDQIKLVEGVREGNLRYLNSSLLNKALNEVVLRELNNIEQIAISLAIDKVGAITEKDILAYEKARIAAQNPGTIKYLSGMKEKEIQKEVNRMEDEEDSTNIAKRTINATDRISDRKEETSNIHEEQTETEKAGKDSMLVGSETVRQAVELNIRSNQTLFQESQFNLDK